MKKILTLIASIMLLSSSMSAQNRDLQKECVSWNYDRGSITRITMDLPSNIKVIDLKGDARLLWSYDTTTYEHIECYFMVDSNEPDTEPYWNGDTLILNNSRRTVYLLHTHHTPRIVTTDDAIPAQIEDITKLDNFSKTLKTTAEASTVIGNGGMMKMLMMAIFTTDDIEDIMDATNRGKSVAENAVDGLMENQSKDRSAGTKTGKRRYDRTDLDLHWGFNNWGTNPFSGMMGMDDPGYDLRTSFSSCQLSWKYRVICRSHFACGVGLGFESDVYKFNKPYVNYSSNSFTAIDTMAPNGYYTTRFVTRYIQLPIHFTYFAKSSHHGFQTSLSAIPAIGFNGKHTGLKHELHQKGINDQDQQNLGGNQNPFKLDVRLDMKISGIGVFLQVATMPVFIEGTKIYPIKIGFRI